MEDYKKQYEENLLKLENEKEEKDRELLRLEIVIGFISTLTFLTLIFVVFYMEMTFFLRIVLITIASMIFMIGMGYALKIEQIAGYYKCKKCNYSYVPEYFSVFWAMHIGRTRYMKCPKCNQRSWQKKVIKNIK